MLSRLKSQTNPTNHEKQRILFAMILNLDPKYLRFLGVIFKGKKRYKQLFYSLTTIGDFIGNYDRSSAGKFAKHLQFLGLLKMDDVTIHGTYIWELGDELLQPFIYAHLYKYFMGFGIVDLLPKLPLDRKFPLYNINKQKSTINEQTARGCLRGRSPRMRLSSPASALRPTQKESLWSYNDRWNEQRWYYERLLKEEAQKEPNKPLTDAEALEIFG